MSTQGGCACSKLAQIETGMLDDNAAPWNPALGYELPAQVHADGVFDRLVGAASAWRFGGAFGDLQANAVPAILSWLQDHGVGAHVVGHSFFAGPAA